MGPPFPMLRQKDNKVGEKRAQVSTRHPMEDGCNFVSHREIRRHHSSSWGASGMPEVKERVDFTQVR